MKGMRYKIALLPVAAIPSGDAPRRHRRAGDGGLAEERRERSNGCGYLIKPRDI